MSYTPEEQAKIRAANNMAKRFSGNGNAPSLVGLMKRLEDLTDYLRSLEQGMISLSSGMQMMSVETNISRLSHNLVFKILVDKKLMTEEEAKAMYETEVSEKIRKYLEDLQKQVETEESPTVSPEAAPVIPESSTPELIVSDSDVVLPSEANPVVVFNSEGAVDLTK